MPSAFRRRTPFIATLILLLCTDMVSAFRSERKLIITTSATSDSLLYARLMTMREDVHRRTEGDVEIEIIANNFDASPATLLAMARNGAPVAVLANSSHLADYVPDFMVLATYTKDPVTLQKLSKSRTFVEWKSRLSLLHNLQILSFDWPGEANNDPGGLIAPASWYHELPAHYRAILKEEAALQAGR